MRLNRGVIINNCTTTRFQIQFIHQPRRLANQPRIISKDDTVDDAKTRKIKERDIEL